MRVASFCALYPPNVLGGAEISAHNLMNHLVRRGHEVRVLTSALNGPAEIREECGIEITRVTMPRPYSPFDRQAQPVWRKLLWHAQDHLDPRNRAIWGEFLDRVRPDVALVHIPQGLGYNGMLELAKRDVPTVAVLHDLSYVCYKTTMFRDGHTCEAPCKPCSASSRVKGKFLSSIPRLGLVSPSLANLRRVQAFMPVAGRPSTVILNPNVYPMAERVERDPAGPVRLLYVGQISRAKGVEFLLELCEELASTQSIELVVVGTGIAADDLRTRFGDAPWVRFTGHISLEDVAAQMAEADVLCVPSIWPDNSPGVIVHALQLGLPVLGSAIGGIGELINDEAEGLLLAPGDWNAWRAAILRVIRAPDDVTRWSRTALAGAGRFAPDGSVLAYEAFIDLVCALRRRTN